MGRCSGSDVPGSMQPYAGRGLGRGRGGWYQGGWFPAGRGGGRGAGWRHWLQATGLPRWLRFGGETTAGMPDESVELQALRDHASGLQAELSAVRRRLEELEAGKNRDTGE